MKKGIGWLRSMKFALGLLLLLIVACIIGSLSESYDVYHSWWFILLSAGLCVSLIACNLSRVSVLIHFPFSSAGMELSEPVSVLEDQPERLFESMKIPVEQRDSNRLYGVRHKIGIWGAWLTHLGILIIILGFGLGQIFTVKYSVYGVAGDTKPVEGTVYELTIDSFETRLRDDETVEQYESRITMKDTQSGETQSGTVSVNHPCTLFGMKAYQNSTGWAATVTVLKDGEQIQQEVLCTGEYLNVLGQEMLAVVFTAFYPDYDPLTMSSRSSALADPAYVYMLYYGEELLGMNILMDGKDITIDNYTIRFSDPQQYSLITLKNDPFTALALVGAVVILFALFVAFYLRTEELLAVQNEDGRWDIYGRSRKGGILYTEKIAEECKKL